MSKDIKMIGQMDNSDGTFESANRVYDRKYVAPTIPTCGGGGYSQRVLGHLEVGGQKGRVWNRKMTIGTLTGTDYKDPPKVIRTYKATVAMRGREKGQCLEYHTDGITNTITTVQKDNMTVCMLKV